MKYILWLLIFNLNNLNAIIVILIYCLCSFNIPTQFTQNFQFDFYGVTKLKRIIEL